jgi:protein-tyrosine-phosphatase
MLREHDLVVVMETDQQTRLAVDWQIPSRQVLVLGDLDPVPIQTRTIKDPYAGSPHEFAECYARVQRCVDALTAILRRLPSRDTSE